MQLGKSNSATHFCKVCFNAPKKHDTASIFNDYPICSACFHKMRPTFVVTKLDGTKVSSLYLYNDTVKSMLYQFKGCFDIEMAPVFLARQATYLKLVYRDWILVPAPSNNERNETRGFNHVEEMFKCLNKPFIHPISKTDNVKQADLNFEERQNIGKHLSWNEGVVVRGKKILFVDDLMTTGATAKACIKMLKEHGANKVEVLVMARTPSPNKRNTFVDCFIKKLQQIGTIFRKSRDK